MAESEPMYAEVRRMRFRQYAVGVIDQPQRFSWRRRHRVTCAEDVRESAMGPMVMIQRACMATAVDLTYMLYASWISRSSAGRSDFETGERT